MKEIPSREILLEKLSYDTKTGLLYWRANRGSGVNGGMAGSLNVSGYTHVCINGEKYLAHRVVWMICTGEQPPEQIDHMDGSRSNNRFENLRASTNAKNQQNRRISSSNKSGYMGVRPSLNKWRAEIRSSGVFVYLGTYDTPELADEAYRTAKKKLHSFNPVPRTTNYTNIAT